MKTTTNNETLKIQTKCIVDTVLKKNGIGFFTRKAIVNSINSRFSTKNIELYSGTDNTEVIFINNFTLGGGKVVSVRFKDQKISGLSEKVSLFNEYHNQDYVGEVIIITENDNSTSIYEGIIEEDGNIIFRPCTAILAA